MAELLERLVEPASFDYSKVLSIEPRINFKLGLTFPSPPINLACLSLLYKATYSPGDAAIVASDPDIILALVEAWLTTPETAIAARSLRILSGLLEIDVVGSSSNRDEPSLNSHGQGLVWRRILRDRDIYGRLFSLCSLSTLGQEGQPNARNKTVAQARLLEFLGLFARFRELRSPQLPGIESDYCVTDGGLLEFATLHMIDYEGDIMMHANLIEFLVTYVSQYDDISSALGPPVLVEPTPHSSVALDFLISKGLHSRTISYFIDPEKLDSLISPRSANYLSAYVSRCPNHFLQTDQSLSKAIIHCLAGRLRAASWINNNAPKSTLQVLASLPRKALVPQSDGESHHFLIPTIKANVDAFNTLSLVFGRAADDASQPLISARMNQERRKFFENDREIAHVLYQSYLDKNPSFWQDIVSTARKVALKEEALEAVHLIGAVLSARWGPTGAASAFSGTVAILKEPTRDIVLPYLMERDQIFSGEGDSSSTAYAVATARHDVLVLLHRKIKELATNHSTDPDGESWRELLGAIGRRAAQGPLGISSNVGGHVGLLEL